MDLSSKRTKYNTNIKPDQNSDSLHLAIEYIQNNNPDKAIIELESLLEKENDYPCRIYCQLGAAYLLKKEYKVSENYLNTALQKNSQLWEAWFNLGMLYQNQGMFEKALISYKEAITLHGHDSEIYELMGDCCIALNNDNDAKTFYDASLKINPKSLHVAISLAQIYLNLRDY